MGINNKKIFVIGDLILDEYIVGEDYRISDEAPVPIVKVNGFIPRLGGAANVANNIKYLGWDVLLCGAIGESDHGKSASRFVEEMRDRDLSTFCVVEGPIKTTTKSRVIIRGQQVVRFDYEDTQLPYHVHHEIMEKLHYLDFGKIELIVVSDYRKGVITPDVINFLKSTGVKIVVDPKPQNMGLYKGVFCITPNLREFNQIINNSFTKDALEVMPAAADKLREKLNIELLVITLGDEGALYCTEGECNIIPAHKVEVSNIIGAGDTFVAALCCSLAEHKNIVGSVKTAITAASIVVSKEYTGICARQEIETHLKGGANE